MLTRTNIIRLAIIEEGVPIWGCTPGSPAALAGMRYGDIVLSVNGCRTKTVDEYVACKNSGAKKHDVEIRRGAEVFTITIEPGPEVWPDFTEQMTDVVGADSLWWYRAGSAPEWRN